MNSGRNACRPPLTLPPKRRTAPAEGALAAMAKSTDYHQADVTADGPLADLLAGLEGPVAVYFALPPQVSQKACEILFAA